jgi:hypothetical protein
MILVNISVRFRYVDQNHRCRESGLATEDSPDPFSINVETPIGPILPAPCFDDLRGGLLGFKDHRRAGELHPARCHRTCFQNRSLRGEVAGQQGYLSPSTDCPADGSRPYRVPGFGDIFAQHFPVTVIQSRFSVPYSRQESAESR